MKQGLFEPGTCFSQVFSQHLNPRAYSWAGSQVAWSMGSQTEGSQGCLWGCGQGEANMG